MFHDGLDGGSVQDGIRRGGVFVVRRRVGVLPQLAAEEPGMDEAGPERPAAERAFGDPGERYGPFDPVGRTRGQAAPREVTRLKVAEGREFRSA